MARPISQGIDYFPLDVGFLRDIKVRKIIRACGISATPILIDLLGNIFRDEGYYMRWGEDEPFLIADEVGVSEGAVIETVQKAVQVDFFNANMFETYGILTSRGIQKRFFKAVERRKEICYDARFLLISVNVCNNLVNAYNNSINVCSNEQRKVKESKGKESKGKEKTYSTISNEIDSIVSYLNNKASTKYRTSTPKTKQCINARLKEGYTIDDFYLVIDKKCNEWMNTEMEKFIRPETLFGNKFESYLNQKDRHKNNNKQDAIDVVFKVANKYSEVNDEQENNSPDIGAVTNSLSEVY